MGAGFCCAGHCRHTETQRFPPDAPTGGTLSLEQQTRGYPAVKDKDVHRVDVQPGIELPALQLVGGLLYPVSHSQPICPGLQ